MAGRIPDSFIHDLLTRTDIVQVIGERLQLKKAGKEYVALSPFTNEKSPSFTVSPQKQFYHCFSSGKHGSAITFLMEYDRLSFVEAVEELARRAGVTVPREGGGTGAPRPVLDGPLDALALAERVYRAELKKSPAAIEYLKQRGITGETAKAFGIGFAPDAWDTLARQLPQPQHALDAGLLVKNDQGRIYDFYRNRIMFPVRDLRGRVITFGGRVMPGSDDSRKYLNGRETELFNKSRNLYGLYEARQGTGDIPYIVVVEGYMDAVMLAQHGVRHVVATLGTATTREHLGLLFKSTSRVVFCFDGDRAGRAAAWRALEQALPEAHEGRECRFVFLPEGHDPDTLIQEIGADAFRERIAGAPSLATFLVGELTRQVDLTTPDGRARLAALARPHLARLREGALRSLILDELARLTRLTHADLEAEGARGKAGQTGVSPENTSLTPVSAAVAQPVRSALQLLLERPALAERVESIDLIAQSGAAGAAVLADALHFFRDHPEAHASLLLEAWRGSDRGALVDQLSVAPLELDESVYETEFVEQIGKLTERALHRALRDRIETVSRGAAGRALTPEETAELTALNRSLASQKVSNPG